MIEVTAANEVWLSMFFSGRNQLRWEKLKANIAPEGWSSEVSDWVSLVDGVGQNEDIPICLPCLADDGSVQWYAGARTLIGSHALIDELRAFVGPSFSDYGDRPHDLDAADPQEAALKNIFVGSVFRIQGRDENEISDLNRSFALFRAVLARRPSTLTIATRPFGIVRGLFDRALSAGNGEEAHLLLDEMKKSGRLTSENLKFLEVRLLAGLGLWQELVVESNRLKELTDFDLPPRVVRDVTEAFYRSYVQEHDENGGLKACLEKLRVSSMTRLDRLFSRRRNIQHPEVIKVFLLRELLQDPIDLVYAGDLLTTLDGNFATPLVGEISDFLGAMARDPGREELLAKAKTAFEDGDYDRALVLYLQAPPDLDSIKRMNFCAISSGDQRSARTVLDFVRSHPDVALDDGVENTLKALERQAEPIPKIELPSASKDTTTSNETSGWLDWARWVDEGAGKQEALSILRQNSDTWSVETLCQDPPSVAAFADFLGNASGDAEETFKAAFDDIFQNFLLDFDGPDVSLKPLYRNLLFLLVASPSLSESDLSVAMQLTSSLLGFGLTKPEYDDVIDQLDEMFESEKALNSLDWALDLLEGLVLERCQDEEARLRFFTKVSLFAQQSAHRITESQRCALEALHRDFKITMPTVFNEAADHVEDDDGDDVASRLAGKRVAIYTLTEPAGKRARDTLKELAPESEIILNSDHVCTENLSALAKSADIFVFAWKSSKHQAFYCVKNHRPTELPLLQPLGKGSASILREVLDHV